MKYLKVAAVFPSALVIVLSGCGLLFGEAEKDVPVKEAEEPAVVDEVLAAIEPLTQTEGLPSSEDTFQALIDAGYDADGLEATQDRTPLDFEVPSKQFAVKVEEGCVIGEIREGNATARLYPETESMKNCLYGAIDRPEDAKVPKGDKIEEDGDDNGVGYMPGEDLNERKDGKESGSASKSNDESTSTETQDAGPSELGGD